MSEAICINLAYEDALSEAVLRRLLEHSGRCYQIGTSYHRGGSGYLRRIVAGLNNAARGMPCLVLTDLDQAECAPALIRDWLRPASHHPNLLLRVAVKEVEAWLLADRKGFADFIGIREESIPLDSDSIEHPKESLINLVGRSRRRRLREAILPPPGSTSKQGPDYNGALIPFVQDDWNPANAARMSSSLERIVRTLKEFQPV